jgi:DnaJ-domain-containing protein 1
MSFSNISTDMFGLFGKASPAEKLEKKYRKLLEEAHRLSHIDRAKSDLMMAEAEEVMKEMERLSKSKS